MDHYHLATRGDSDGLWDWNLATDRVHYAPRWVAMLGCADHEVGQSPEEWLNRVHPEDRPGVQGEIDTVLAQDATEFTLQHRMRHKDGSYRWMACHAVIVRNEAGRAVRMMGVHTDVTADRGSDTPTGLPNRLLFLDRLERAIEQARRSPEFLFAAIIVDLDRPGPAHPSAEPGPSDPLLAAAARRLETCLRSGDAPANLGHEHLVSRLGGDRFGILVEGLAQIGEASVSAQRVLSGMLAPFSIGGTDVFVRASVGVAVSVTGYRRGEDVLRDADTALHRARALGKGRCEVFDTALLDSARSELELEAELERAIERREFVLHYQPIVSLASNRVAGLEALVRWQHPTRGLVPPMEFIPLAEKTGAIGRIGAWVVREACRQLSAWRSSLPIPRDLWVSVNLSSVQFDDPSLFEQIGNAVRDAALDPRCLMVELTEGTVMENPAAARGLVMQLRVLGVRVGLDDFGTGHSALSYLHQFPADFLKVDRSFIRGLDARHDMAEIVRTVNDLADRLGLEVIAEGIERGEQLAIVRSLRCGYVQGFLLARPVDSERAAELLANGLEMPDTATRTERPWAWRTLAAAAATVVLLVSAGLVVRVASLPRKTPAAAATAARLAQSEPARPPVARAPVSSVPGMPGSSSAPPAPAATGEVPRPASPGAETVPGRRSGPGAKTTAFVAEGPAVKTFEVAHLHAIGRCTGRLLVTPAGVSFVPDKGKDAFAIPYQSFLVTLSDGALVIKSEKRTYRFKAPGDAAGPGPSPMQAVYDSIRRQPH